MRVAFLSASRFGARCIEQALRLDCVQGVGIVTAPRRFSISYRPQGVENVLHVDHGELAKRHDLPLIEIQSGMRDAALRQTLAGLRPELLLVTGWYHLVPRSLRELAPAVGLHASLLPDYRGGAPLVWAIINGESRAGISLFQLADGVDDGPLLGQAEVAILFEDDIATLYARVEEQGLRLLAEYLPLLASGSAVYTPQDLSRGRAFPQRSPEDGEIDWRWDAARVYDFVRAQTRPYPGAFTWLGSEPLTLWRCRPGPTAR